MSLYLAEAQGSHSLWVTVKENILLLLAVQYF